MNYIWLLGGFVGGSLFGWVIRRMKPTAGTLRIDHSNPEKDVYRFDINDFDSLSKKKRIVLLVDNNADLSQK